MPPWPDHPGPDEWVDPATSGALGKTVDGYNTSYCLDSHEALVIFAQMPPPAAFFGLKTYLFNRDGVLCDGSKQHSFVQTNLPAMFPTFFSLVPNEPTSTSRVQILANLSNSPNNIVISNRSGAVWAQLRYFIHYPEYPESEHGCCGSQCPNEDRYSQTEHLYGEGGRSYPPGLGSTKLPRCVSRTLWSRSAGG